jgi:hypothetical protein
MALILLSRPKEQNVEPLLTVGDTVPNAPSLSTSESWQVIAFLRHVGCPFAENMVKKLRLLAEDSPKAGVYIVSHGDEMTINSWLNTIGGKGRLQLIVDPHREVYGKWGLGFSNLWHFLGIRSLIGVIYLSFKGIRNRKASGTRWQQAAIFLVKDSKVAWSHVPNSAEELELPPDHLFQ